MRGHEQARPAPPQGAGGKTTRARRQVFSSKLRAELLATSHVVRHAGRRATCIRCHSGAPWGALGRWLRSECMATVREPCAPAAPVGASDSAQPECGPLQEASRKRHRTSLDQPDAGPEPGEDAFDHALTPEPPPPRSWKTAHYAGCEAEDAKRRRTSGKAWLPALVAISRASEAAVLVSSASGSGGDSAHQGAGWEGGDALLVSSFHHSHLPHWKGRFLWCGRCGGWSTGGKPDGALHLPCPPGGPTRSGRGVLSRVARGLPPHSSHRTWS